uniref:Uncharacterized protein n=1 Tax=Chenopodium quinoa TaxID=63459 RepID=A0A803MH27_CHEQI
MDLLCKTYSNSSEDEDEQQIQPSKIIPPPSKRPKPYYTPIHKPVFQAPNPQIGAPNSSTGRYISKREKALMASASTTHADPLPTLPPSPEMGSISSAYVRPDILLSLKKRTKTCAEKNKLPFRLSIGLNGHVKAVNAVQWSTSHEKMVSVVSSGGPFEKMMRLDGGGGVGADGKGIGCCVAVGSENGEQQWG